MKGLGGGWRFGCIRFLGMRARLVDDVSELAGTPAQHGKEHHRQRDASVLQEPGELPVSHRLLFVAEHQAVLGKHLSEKQVLDEIGAFAGIQIQRGELLRDFGA